MRKKLCTDQLIVRMTVLCWKHHMPFVLGPHQGEEVVNVDICGWYGLCMARSRTLLLIISAT